VQSSISKKIINGGTFNETKTPDWAKRLNYYKLIKDKPTYKNPHAGSHGIEHPFRMIIVGETGAGKTQLTLDILRVTNCFDEVYVFSPFGEKDKLWNLAKERFTRGPFLVTTNFSDIPDPTQEMTDEKQKVVIFDDAIGCSPAVNRSISLYNTGSRKMNVSVINIYQTYFNVPRITRLNPKYVVLLAGINTTDINNFKDIARKYGNVQQIMDMYKRCQGDPDDFFWIDCNGPPDQRWRRGFSKVTHPRPLEELTVTKEPESKKRKFRNLSQSTINSSV